MSEEGIIEGGSTTMENLDLLASLLCQENEEPRAEERKKRRIVTRKFTDYEETYLAEAVIKLEMHNWKQIAQYLAKKSGEPQRPSEQVSQHWRRVSNPMLKKNCFTEEEIAVLRHLYAIYGMQWREIASIMHRTDVSVRYQIFELIRKEEL